MALSDAEKIIARETDGVERFAKLVPKIFNAHEQEPATGTSKNSKNQTGGSTEAKGDGGGDDDDPEVQTNYGLRYMSSRSNGNLRASIVFREVVSRFLYHPRVSAFLTALIVYNTVMICLETDSRVKSEYVLLLQVSDMVCIIIFSVEIVLRMITSFWEFVSSGFNIFDATIVGLSLIASQIPSLSSLAMVRCLRIIRSFRLMKLTLMSSELGRVTASLVRSSGKMVVTLFLVLIFAVIMALFGVALFRTASPTWFGSVTKSLYSVVILLTMDGWLDMYGELKENGMGTMGMIYIVVTIIAGANVLVNLLIGVAYNGVKYANEEFNTQKMNLEPDVISENRDAMREFSMPPLPNDLAWTMQKKDEREQPSFDHIDQDALARLYIVQRMMEKNSQRMEGLVERLDYIVSSVIESSPRQMKNTPMSEESNAPT